MLDIILIQHAETGINLLEYRQEDTQFKSEHSDIFTGFLTAIQSISHELDIGTVVLISTKGSKGHNCIIVPKPPINIIILVDRSDPIEIWREQGAILADKFLKQFSNNFDPNNISQFQSFIPIVKEMCLFNPYCD
ncbi:MAG: hypothetical protein ACFFBP_17720 [Promethearchaeota archaeon]